MTDSNVAARAGAAILERRRPRPCQPPARAGGVPCRRRRTLFPEESTLLGPVAGRSVLHLLCNTGQDSLSLAAAGARVTGVDISDEAIAAPGGSPGEGHRGAVRARGRARLARRQPARATPTTSRSRRTGPSAGYATWLGLPRRWRRVVRPGGRFVLVDFHPVAAIFDGQWRRREPYLTGGAPLELDGVEDYVGAAGGGLSPGGFAPGVDEFRNPTPASCTRWGLGDVVTAFSTASWVVQRLEEYPFANGERQFDRMRALAGRRLAPPPDVPSVPLMYGLLAGRNPA